VSTGKGSMLPGDQILGRFEIVRALVRSAERPSTFRVRDLREDRLGILKLVQTDSAADDPFNAEVELLRAIPHDEARAAHIAPLLDSGHDDGVLWMLTEDVGEQHVGQHLQQRPDIGMAPRLGFDEVLDLLEAIGLALAALHGRRILHLDVKEANVVVDPSAGGTGRYWLVDLGIGRRLREGRSTATADLRGTLDGIAPELLHPSRQVGPPADIYALCGVALRCLRERPQEKWPVARREQLRTCGLLPGDPRHAALLRLLSRGMDERAGRRPAAARLVQRVRAIRQGRVWHARRLLPFAAISPLLLAAALLAFGWMTAPPLTFEDATTAWGLAAPAPGTQPVPGYEGRSSGFYWVPSVIVHPSRGNLRLYVPRGLRQWGETAAGLQHDLVAELVDGRFRWSLADAPDAEHNHYRAIDVDLDGDGHLDRIVITLMANGTFAHHVWFGPEPWSRLERSPGLPSGDEGTCVPSQTEDPDDVGGYPLLLPPELGAARPRILTSNADRHCLATWGRDTIESRPAPPGFEGPITWLDLESDGLLDMVVRDGETLVTLSLRPDGHWDSRPCAEVDTRYEQASTGDIDGDGDEDVVVMTYMREAFVVLLNEGGRLTQRDVTGATPLEPGEENWETITLDDLADLDGDGLPELVVQSCGFERRGAAVPKVFRNLGGLVFERVPLPDSLRAPHDGAEILVVDVDADGLPDLLDLAVNDQHLEVPTHRAWRTTSRSADRLWPVDLRTPTGGELPLGTRIRAAGDRPWLHVVREAGPVSMPSWLTGPLLVQLPTGDILVTDRVDALDGPREIRLQRNDPPALLAGGGQPIEGGRVAPEPGRVFYRARRGGLDVRLQQVTEHGMTEQIVIASEEGDQVLEVGALRIGLGCHRRDRCLFMEADPTGGLTPLLLDPTTGSLTRQPEIGDMTLGAVVRDGRAWVAADHELSIRDPESYALLRQSADYDVTLGECYGLGLSGDVLACATSPVRRLVLYDAETLRELERHVVPVSHPWGVVGVTGGWAVTTDDGMAWVDDSGEVARVRLGEPLSLTSSGDVLWAVGQDRAFWLDPATRRILGGLVAPGVGDSWPTGPEGEHGGR
jgi:hypothetical protein